MFGSFQSYMANECSYSRTYDYLSTLSMKGTYCINVLYNPSHGIHNRYCVCVNIYFIHYVHIYLNRGACAGIMGCGPTKSTAVVHPTTIDPSHVSQQSRKYAVSVSTINVTSLRESQCNGVVTTLDRHYSQLSLQCSNHGSAVSITSFTLGSEGEEEGAYLTATPPTALKTWSVEDTFWEKKKILMPNKETLEMLDKHSVEVSVFVTK